MSSMSTTERLALDNKIRGWESVSADLRAMLDRARAETVRLLGPDRGE